MRCKLCSRSVGLLARHCNQRFDESVQRRTSPEMKPGGFDQIHRGKVLVDEGAPGTKECKSCCIYPKRAFVTAGEGQEEKRWADRMARDGQGWSRTLK